MQLEINAAFERIVASDQRKNAPSRHEQVRSPGGLATSAR